jgi:FkbM family methyltransferase
MKTYLRTIAQRYLPHLWVRYSHWRSAKEREMAELSAVVPSGRVALDIGAYSGMYTRPLAHIASRVYAFEPTEMANTLARSSAKNVVVHRIAISDRVGTAKLRIPNSTTCGTLESVYSGGLVVEVPVSTIDAMIGDEDIGFIKIDVEGHEIAVIRGATQTIAKCQPILLIECEERFNAQSQQTILSMLPSGYKCQYLDANGNMQDLLRFNPNKDQVQGSEPYINNFFFFPPRPHQASSAHL